MSEDYKRPDGRGLKDLRDLTVEVGVLDRADGSARVDLGKNIAVATVYGPREMHPKHASRTDSAVVRINYRMATFSVDDYKRPYPSRREKEISKVLSEAYESVILNENWPRSVVDVHIQIFQSDGGTRTAAAIAITAALADAGIPMRDLPGAIATGLYDEKVALDLTGHEDMKGTGDMPMMYSPSIDEVSLFQLDGKFTLKEFEEAYYTSIDAIKTIVAKIQNALKEKYLVVRDEYGMDEDEEDVDIDDAMLDEAIEDDEEEEMDYEGDDEEDEEEITPVPTEPVGTSHSMSMSGVSEEDKGVAEITSDPSPKPEDVPSEVSTSVQETETTSGSGPIPSPAAPTPDDETSDQDLPETDQDIESSISNKWFTKSGGDLRAMKPKDTEEDEDEDDETSNIMRDIEYSLDEED